MPQVKTILHIKLTDFYSYIMKKEPNVINRLTLLCIAIKLIYLLRPVHL